jgi:BA14K-like protein
MTLTVTALALASALAAFPALAQQSTGRNVNDGGMPAEPAGAPQYTGSGQVVPAPGNEVGTNDCAARFRSYDAATGTYLGFDGQRHPCS